MTSSPFSSAMSAGIARVVMRCAISVPRLNLYTLVVAGYPPIIPGEVGMAFPEDKVSCVITPVWCGMKQDSAESPPR